MRRRVIALVAALLLAGVGTLVLVNFVRGAEERAVAGEELATVFVVQTPIGQGTPAEEIAGSLVQEQVPVKVRPPDAVTDLAQLAGLVTSVDLLPGEQLIASRFTVAAEVEVDRRDDLPTLRVQVPEGMLEVPIRLTTEQALGGIIDVGDTVAVISSLGIAGGANQTVETENGDTVAVPDSAQEGEARTVTGILLRNALIIQVQADTTPTFATGDDSESVLVPQSNFIVHFALSPQDASRLVFAAQNGDLWLARQTPDDNGESRLVDDSNIFED